MSATRICGTLCRIIDGQAPAPTGPLSAAAATRWFQRNKYPLLSVAGVAPAWLRDDAFFQQQLAAETEWYTTQRHEYVLVRQAWQERQIECLMIKSAGNAPSFPYASDNIDIEVRPERAGEARD